MHYVTKWALTQGILRVVDGEEDGGYLTSGTGAWKLFVPKRDYFTSLAEAEQRVEQMKKKRRSALGKALKKLSEPVVIVDYSQAVKR